MKFFSLLLCSILAFCCLDLTTAKEKLEKYALNLQSFCESQFSPHQESKNLSSAFICGTGIGDFKQQQAFQSTGLIHLIVVSGSHLKMLSLFLVNFLSLFLFLKKHKQLILICLLFPYCLVTGFQAPILRAFVLLLVVIAAKYFRTNWTFNQLCLASGIILITIFPEWIFNFSFYLSWLASLGFCFPLESKKNLPLSTVIRFAFSCLLIQFFIFLLSQTFSVISFVANLIIAPILSVLLWPISLSGLISQRLIPFADFSWDLIVRLLSQISEQVDPTQTLQLSRFDWIFAWSLVCLLHSLFFYLHKVQRQQCYKL